MEDGNWRYIMSRETALIRPDGALASLEQLVETAREYAADSRASSTPQGSSQIRPKKITSKAAKGWRARQEIILYS